MDKPLEASIIRHIRKNEYEVKNPDGENVVVDFDEINVLDEVDPPYGYEGTMSGADDKYLYTMGASLVNMGGGDYDADPDYGSLEVELIPDNPRYSYKNTGPEYTEESLSDMTDEDLMEALNEMLSEEKTDEDEIENGKDI